MNQLDVLSTTAEELLNEHAQATNAFLAQYIESLGNAPPRLAETPACDSSTPETVLEKSATSKTRTARRAARPSCRGWAIT